MKKLIVIALLLITSTCYATSYYPYGKDVNGFTAFSTTASDNFISQGSITSSGTIVNVRTISKNDFLYATDRVIIATGKGVDLRLPTAVGIPGQVFNIKNCGYGPRPLYIYTKQTTSEKIDEASSFVISARLGSVMVVSDGYNWQIN